MEQANGVASYTTDSTGNRATILLCRTNKASALVDIKVLSDIFLWSWSHDFDKIYYISSNFCNTYIQEETIPSMAWSRYGTYSYHTIPYTIVWYHTIYLVCGINFEKLCKSNAPFGSSLIRRKEVCPDPCVWYGRSTLSYHTESRSIHNCFRRRIDLLFCLNTDDILFFSAYNSFFLKFFRFSLTD